MRVATYNILKGGTRRVHWTKLIEDHAVDLLLVQESYSHEEHLRPVVYPKAKDLTVWRRIGNYRWGSAIYSRSGAVAPVSVPGFAGWVVGAEIKSACWQNGLCDSILVFSVHVPLKDGTYAGQTSKMLDRIRRIAKGREVLIGGDFNLTVSNWNGSERPVAKRDLAIQARLAEEFGLINCWQESNPNQPLHQTLRWTGNRTTPYHCDGLFAPKAWKSRLQSCQVLSGDEWDVLSDHNPVVATFR